MRRLIVTILMVLTFLACVLPVTQITAAAETSAKGAVLVTGASTGIGRKITERLAAKGYFVYAGARKDSDLQALNTIKNVRAVKLDVTKPEEIAAAVNAISKEGRGLYGLVNNAGLTSFGSVTDVEMGEFDQVMAVNLTGPFRVAKAFAPLIVAAKGRVVNISSILGIASAEKMSVYSMTKHAIESFTDSFAKEMEPFEVKVSAVEPGTYKTDINQNAFKRANKEAPENLHSIEDSLKEPDEVAAAVELALFEQNPKRRYLVVPVENQHEMVIKKQLEQLVQLNEGQPYTYDRETLAKMLDEALKNSRPRTQR